MGSKNQDNDRMCVKSVVEEVYIAFCCLYDCLILSCLSFSVSLTCFLLPYPSSSSSSFFDKKSVIE